MLSKYIFFFFLAFTFNYSSAQLGHVYTSNNKNINFGVVICGDNFMFIPPFLDQKITKVRDNLFCSVNYHGKLIIKNDTLVLMDSKFGNRYCFIVDSVGLKPIRPNYPFLLQTGVKLQLTSDDDLYDFVCNKLNDNPRVQTKRKYKIWYDIDTNSTQYPEKYYRRQGILVTFKNNIVRIKISGLLFFEGIFRIEKNQIVFYSEDLQKEFVINFGVKSYRDIVLDMDPLLNICSVPKKYTRKQWLNVIDTAKEFKFNLGGKGAGPNIEKIKE